MSAGDFEVHPVGTKALIDRLQGDPRAQREHLAAAISSGALSPDRALAIAAVRSPARFDWRLILAWLILAFLAGFVAGCLL